MGNNFSHLACVGVFMYFYYNISKKNSTEVDNMNFFTKKIKEPNIHISTSDPKSEDKPFLQQKRPREESIEKANSSNNISSEIDKLKNRANHNPPSDVLVVYQPNMIKKISDQFEVVKDKIHFTQQKYFKIKLDLVLPDSLSIAKKYTCDECSDKVVTLPAVKCSNCRFNYWCESCFYRKRTTNQCKKCHTNVVIPLQLNLEEKKELKKISTKCQYDIKCGKKIPYEYFYDHGINCNFASNKEYLDSNTKFIYLDQYESNKQKRKNFPKTNDIENNLEDYYSHLRNTNPITMSRNYDLRENYLPCINDIAPGHETIAKKYVCILCKYNKRDCLPRNEVAKCRYCNGKFCLNCFYERNLPSGPNTQGWKIHDNTCPECFNYLLYPQHLSSQEVGELKSIKIKCKYNDRGCPIQNYFYEIPLHAVNCEYSKLPAPVPKKQQQTISNIPPVDKKVNNYDDEVKEFILVTKHKWKDALNITDPNLLEMIATVGLSKLTVEQLRWVLYERKVGCTSRYLKDELLDLLSDYLKQKFSREFIYNNIICNEKYVEYKIDELRGLLILKGYTGTPNGMKSKVDYVEVLKNHLKIK